MSERGGYKPIADYGMIGNLRTAALVGKDGSIDWCCLPRMAGASVFGALLDTRRGGRFRVSMQSVPSGEQRYIEDTNVLVTEFRSGVATLSVTDFMPLAGNIYRGTASYAPEEIHRVLACRGGDVEVLVEWSPRFDYARSPVLIRRIEGGWLAEGGGHAMVLCGLEGAGVAGEGNAQTLRARLRLQKGRRCALVTRWQTNNTACDLRDSSKLLHHTVEVWRQWAHREGTVHNHEWAGEWYPLLIRSELVLKMLAYAETGAIAAAPTASLPEEIGGVRNWDYRFAWVRDASLAAQALTSLGHAGEAVEFLHWIENVAAEEYARKREIQIMYGLHGEYELEEEELAHLEGYRRSRPVNTGNGAVSQFQLGIFGELLNTVYEMVRRGEPLENKIRDFAVKIADYICRIWRKPDHGIWEFRGEARHYTYSKVMAWTGLDRAVRLSEQYGFPGDSRRWRGEREIIREEVLRHGYNAGMRSFVQSFDSDVLDAANLRIPMLEFLPFGDYRVQETIDRTMEHLMTDGFVYRYHADDGLPGKEGAFILCTFWLVDALALSGRVREAREIYRRIVACANHVGLLPEEIDPATGEFLGNFPQAFSHIGLINSALYLACAEGRRMPEHAPIGTPAHRKDAPEKVFGKE